MTKSCCNEPVPENAFMADDGGIVEKEREEKRGKINSSLETKKIYWEIFTITQIKHFSAVLKRFFTYYAIDVIDKHNRMSMFYVFVVDVAVVHHFLESGDSG